MQIFYGRTTFYRYSMKKIPFTGILWIEDLLCVFYIRKTPYRSSIVKRGFSGLLELQEFLRTFYRWRRLYTIIYLLFTIRMYSTPETLFTKGFSVQNTFEMSSTSKKPYFRIKRKLWIKKKYLWIFFYWKKAFKWSLIFRRPSYDPLWTFFN